VVEAGVEFRPHLVDDPEGKRDLRPRDDRDPGGRELDPPVGLLGPANRTLHVEDRLPRELGEESEKLGVGDPLLQRDLGGARTVPDQGERDAAERPVVLEMTRDPDDLAVPRGELTR